MDGHHQQERAATRLLYDDQAPRLRRPVNPTVLRLRRPGALFFPLSLLFAAGIPGAGTAWLAGRVGVAVPDAAVAVLTTSGGFALVLMCALALARREEKSFALLLPNVLSVAHAILAVGFLAAFALIQQPGFSVIGRYAGLVPGPRFDLANHQLAYAYCILFLLVTAGGIIASVLFRLVGLGRVRLREDEDDNLALQED
jgi:hypothetical protein